MKAILSILFQLSIIAFAESEIFLPTGWKRPSDPIFNQAWRNASKQKYLALGADLNCDGLIDSALILQPESGKGIGVFVFLKDAAGNYKCISIYESMKDKANIENLKPNVKDKIQNQYRVVWGIEEVINGIYKTACGKGYYDCNKGEPEEINLKCSSINFFLSEGANCFYYWDSRLCNFFCVNTFLSFVI
jgi:hypothetical protein